MESYHHVHLYATGFNTTCRTCSDSMKSHIGFLPRICNNDQLGAWKPDEDIMSEYIGSIFNNKPCAFNHSEEKIEPVGILAAWYPPANAVIDGQHVGPTSTLVKKWMGSADFFFHWIDLLPYSPCANGALPTQALNTLKCMIKSMNRTSCHFVASFGCRISTALIREAAKGFIPVVIWAGEMSNIARNRLYEAGLIREDLSVDPQNVAGVRTPWCQVRWCVSIMMAPQQHPS